MSANSTWQEDNARYLSAALNWVRLLLQRQAMRESSHLQSTAPPPEPVEQTEEPSLFQRLFRQGADKSTPMPAGLLLPPSDQSLEQQVDEAAQAMAAAATTTPAPALLLLAERFGLSPFERDVLLLCAALELDTSIASLCNLAQGNVNRAYPTFALALMLFDDPAWEALSPERPLRYWRLVEINQPGAQPLTTSALRADERIVNYLKGLNYVDDRLTPFLIPLHPASSALPLPESQEQAITTIVRKLQQQQTSSHLPVVQLPGSDSASKQLIAWHVVRTLGLHLYRLPAEWLPANAAELDSLARFINRESALLPVAFYVDSVEIEKPAGEARENNRSSILQRFLARLNCLTFLDTRDVRTFSTAQTIIVDVAKPTRAEQQAAWAQVLPDSAVESPAQLAGQFNLGLDEIDRIANTLGIDVPDDELRTPHQRLWDECLASTRPRLDELAQRLDAKATWADLVLPAQEMNLLRQIASQVSQRAKVG
ncbi:MAG TPA: hypothetical protein VHH35_05775 [Pyrinomonadaceae bacterium]|nr:hypothetical protein [Pyrinomonadaceae bacterium]